MSITDLPAQGVIDVGTTLLYHEVRGGWDRCCCSSPAAAAMRASGRASHPSSPRILRS